MPLSVSPQQINRKPIMYSLYDVLISPFVDNPFMRRALVGTLVLALSSPPLGVLLTLRRMSLLGDALSHAVLPGVAIGYLLFGLSLPAMSVGGLCAGLAVVAVAGWVSRHTTLREDASLAATYLVALALGVMLISSQGTQLDLLHILFGSVLAVDHDGLILIAAVATLTLLLLAGFYRGLLLESFDPVFLAASGRRGGFCQQLFLLMIVLNLVAAFQTLGTLMAVGLMMLPAVCARLWCDSLVAQFCASVAIAMLASLSGLLLSYNFDLSSGPAIIVVLGLLYFFSLLMAPRGWLRPLLKRPHLRA
ncbi:MAG: zinc transporter permease [Proteobacteria bacterium]|nr:zinc transporter permease [Pseudomonadota bacterium]